ncbi:MAG: AAA family ATPase [Rhodospirillales bacterium]|nr:AAA family ATPase [Rhodospirillales bacterium]
MHILSFVFDAKVRSKSTLANQVAAVAGSVGDGPVVIVELDEDAVPRDRSPIEPKAEAAPTVARTSLGNLEATLGVLEDEGFAYAFVVTPFTADDAFETVLWGTDLVALCVGSKKADHERLGDAVGIIKKWHKPFFFVLDDVSSKGPKDSVVFYLAQHGTVCPVFVPQQRATAGTESVEVSPDNRAEADETLLLLWNYISDRCGKLAQTAVYADDVEELENRREYPRWQVRWDVSLIRNDERLPARLFDISGSGAGIASDAVLDHGESVCVDIPFVGHYSATIVRGKPGRYGLFLGLDAHEQAFLAERLEKVIAGAEQLQTEAPTSCEACAETVPDIDPEPAPDLDAPEEPAEVSAPAQAPALAIEIDDIPAEPAAAAPHGERARVIVVGNLKGGSGKSTIAMHILVGLLRSGKSVASIDLDAAQGTLSRYLDNRKAHAVTKGIHLPMPECHLSPRSEDEGLVEGLERVAQFVEVIVVDTPGRHNAVTQEALHRADLLITPLNDSFIDLDVLADIDPRNLTFIEQARYGDMVARVRERRRSNGGAPLDWLVLRNRLSNLDARNKRDMADTLAHLSLAMDFQNVPGLSERVIYRQLFLEGLTLLDLRQEDMGIPFTMSHLAARQELRTLLSSILATPAMSEQPHDGDDAEATVADSLTIPICA